MKNIAVLILAAGKSSRMNSIKQLEKINNKTLLDITVEKVSNLFSENIFCVLGANYDDITQEITSKITSMLLFHWICSIPDLVIIVNPLLSL